MRLRRCIVGLLLAAPFVRAQVSASPALRAADFSSLQALIESCLAAPGHSCIVVVDTPHLWSLEHNVAVPPGMHLRFTSAALWTLTGPGALDFANGTLDAPATQIFAPGAHIWNLAEARPEWFASARPDGVLPPEALAAAYAATAPGQTILLSAAAYVSPFTQAAPSPAVPHPLSYDSPRKFVGTTRPTVDDATHPTHLVSGSILLGELTGNAATQMSHLGIDDGPLAVSRYFGGRQGMGLVLYAPARRGTSHGSRLTDIAVLTNGVHDQHSLIVEGQRDLRIEHLWLWTTGGTHGLVVKSSDAVISDFHCSGAKDDCLIVKSDYATDRAGFAEHVLIEHAWITPLEHPGDTGGVVVDSRSDQVRDLTLRDLHLTGLQYGINATGSIFHSLRDFNVDGLSATGLVGPCFQVIHGHGVTLAHFTCSHAASAAPQPASVHLEGSGYALRDGEITCPATPCAVTNAIDDLATATELTRISADSLAGHLLRRSVLTADTLPTLTARHMGQRLRVAYTAPARSLLARFRQFWLDLKPNLRILYTAAGSEVHDIGLVPLAAIAIFAIVALALLARWRRRTMPTGPV